MVWWDKEKQGKSAVLKACAVCGGRGVLRCPKCKGRGRIGTRQCPRCYGQGDVPCGVCDSTGDEKTENAADRIAGTSKRFTFSKVARYIISFVLLGFAAVAGKMCAEVIIPGSSSVQMPINRLQLPTAQTIVPIPSDFTTFRDANGRFTISYPTDWEPALDEIAQQSGNGTNTETIFFGGLPFAGVHDPTVFIRVEPFKSTQRVWTEQDKKQVEAAISSVKAGLESTGASSFLEHKRELTYIDGKPAFILDYSVNLPNIQGIVRFIQACVWSGQELWVVTCAVQEPQDTFRYIEDMYEIVKTLRIL